MKRDQLTKDLFIYQGEKSFRYGIDAVLLAYFAKGLQGKVMDLGTGTGILPLLLASQPSITQIHGLELQEDALDLARASVRDNRLQEKIKLHQGDLMDIQKQFSKENFDGLVTNPPYFKRGHSLSCEDLPRALARSEMAMTLEGLVEAASYLLKPKAALYLIYRPRRLPELLAELLKKKLEPKRMRFVHPEKGKEANLVLLEARKGAGAHCRIETPLFVYEKEEYTPEIYAIYEELSMR